jgi:hypothetical protein
MLSSPRKAAGLGPKPARFCNWADRELDLKNEIDGLKIMSEGTYFEDIPAHVVGLTLGSRDNQKFLLDTQLGVIYWPEYEELQYQRLSSTGNMILGIEHPIYEVGYDPEDVAPDKEIEWRNESPTF